MTNDFNINRMNPYQVQQYVKRITGGLETGTQGPLRNIVNKNPINLLYNSPQASIAESINPTVIRTGSKLGFKNLSKYLPITGDVYDIYSGGRKMLEGHPYIGAAQIGLGGLGLATLGAGSVLKSAAKAGVKGAARKSLSNALRATAKNPYKTRVMPSILLETIGGNKKDKDIEEYIIDLPNIPSVTPTNEMQDEIQNQLPQFTSIEDIINSDSNPYWQQDNNVGNIEDVNDIKDILNNIGEVKTNGTDNDNILNLIKEYTSQQQEMQKPYLNALEDYLNNYNKYNNATRNAQRFYTALAGLSGNQGYRDLAKQYDVSKIEADKVNLIKALQEAKTKSQNVLYENIGNVKLAEAMGLSPEVGLASPNMLKSLSPVLSSMNALAGRKYTADTGLEKARMYTQSREAIARMNNRRALEIAQGTWNNQKEIAYQRNKNNIERAIVQGLGFGVNPAQLLGATNALGYTNITDEQLNALGNLMGTGDID